MVERRVGGGWREGGEGVEVWRGCEGWVEEGMGTGWSEKRLSRICRKLISVVLSATLNAVDAGCMPSASLTVRLCTTTCAARTGSTMVDVIAPAIATRTAGRKFGAVDNTSAKPALLVVEERSWSATTRVLRRTKRVVVVVVVVKELSAVEPLMMVLAVESWSSGCPKFFCGSAGKDEEGLPCPTQVLWHVRPTIGDSRDNIAEKISWDAED